MNGRFLCSWLVVAISATGVTGCNPTPEQRAISLVRELHGAVSSSKGNPWTPGQQAVTVILSSRDVADVDLRPLQGMPHLRRLDLSGSHVTDITMQGIASLCQIKELRLGFQGTQLTDAGFTHLRSLANLEVLWLASTGITDAGLDNISKLTQLRELPGAMLHACRGHAWKLACGHGESAS